MCLASHNCRKLCDSALHFMLYNIYIYTFSEIQLMNSLSIKLNTNLRTKASLDKRLLIGIHLSIYHSKTMKMYHILRDFCGSSSITASIKIQLSALDSLNYPLKKYALPAFIIRQTHGKRKSTIILMLHISSEDASHISVIHTYVFVYIYICHIIGGIQSRR